MNTYRTIAGVILLFLSTLSLYSQEINDRDTGIELYRSGDYKGAVQILEPLFTQGKADYPAALYLAGSYVQLNRSKEAKDVFNKTSKLGETKQKLVYDQKIKFTKRPAPRFNRPELTPGRILVAIECKADGTLGFIIPFATTSPRLIEGAMEAAKAIKFEPAIVKGKPTTVIVITEYNYI